MCIYSHYKAPENHIKITQTKVGEPTNQVISRLLTEYNTQKNDVLGKQKVVVKW